MAMLPHTLDGFHPFGTHSQLQKSSWQNPNHVHIPPVDIRETDTDYFFDVEIPGVTEKEGVSIQWTSTRTLVVEGSIPRVESEAETILHEPFDLEQGGGEDDVDDSTMTNGAGKKAKDGEKIRTVVSERKFGRFKRDFCFPVDVDMHSTKAVLAGGVLTIKTSKKRSEGFPQKVRIHVE